MPQNVFLLLSKYPLVVSLKNLKKNKAILIIVIGLKILLRWNLVKSVLDKEDKSVHVYSPLFNFFICSFSV